MSSDRPSGGPSAQPERGSEAGLELASVLRVRGAPLLEALELHLPGAGDHAEATASYAFSGGVGLGFDRARAEAAREAARLHEVGLIYVAPAIAAKPASARDQAERAAWAEHYEAGSSLARGAAIPEHVCGWLLHAREHYDGNEPGQLTGDRIPLEARLIRAACVCQTSLAGAQESDDPSPLQTTIARLTGLAGGELDPRVVAALTAILERAASS